MKLIDLLVKKLPKRGGFVQGANEAVQDADGNVKFFDSGRLRFERDYECGRWCGSARSDFYCIGNYNFNTTLADDYDSSIVTRDQYEAALAASQQPAWNGGVLPPIGTECEVNRAGDWMCCRIEFISGMHVVMKMAGSEVCWQTCACTFRPLRTEAERKREDLKSAIAEICRQSASNGHSADLIYDAIAAGKIPGVKLED